MSYEYSITETYGGASPRITQRWFKRLRKQGLSWTECETRMREMGLLPREAKRYRLYVWATRSQAVWMTVSGAPDGPVES